MDVGRSVSRVGGRAQLPAYRAVAGDLRLSYSQFEELERFSRYGARLERGKAQALERGRRVREVLKQPRYETLDVDEQVAVLAAVTGGAFDGVPADRVSGMSDAVAREVVSRLGELFEDVRSGAEVGEDDLEEIRRVARDVVRDRRSG